MSEYLSIIKFAITSFPLIALAISLPFILWQYHKYGSISFLKVLIIYSLFFYLTCAYFLVILPLPTFDEVTKLTTPRTQLIPFSFVADFFRETPLRINDPRTYLSALTDSTFFVPIYNILLTLPFGIYLKYYFRCNLSKAIIMSFLLSLFFELTQLTGLYFIYPRGYRLFDVDDLILNTFGGVMGYVIAGLFIKALPSRDQIDQASYRKGQEVSAWRRATAVLLDLFLSVFFYTIIMLIFYNQSMYWQLFLIAYYTIYYIVIPIILNGATIGQKFLKLKIVNEDGHFNIWQLIERKIFYGLVYIILPLGIFNLIAAMPQSEVGREISILSVLALILIFYITNILRFLFGGKPMFYERWSKTKIISMIEVQQE